MAINKVTAGPQKKSASACSDAASWASATRNAYKKIPYIYPAAEFMPRLAVLCDQKAEIVEREAARYGYEALLHRLEGTGRRPADRRVRQLRPRSGASGAVHRRPEGTAST